MTEVVTMLSKPRKSVRFSVGIKDSETATVSSSPENYLTELSPEKDPNTKGEITDIKGECVETLQVQHNTPKEQFLEHLLHVDEIENGHVKTELISDDEDIESPKDKKSSKGSSFITTRNYFDERGIVIAPIPTHEQKIFKITRVERNKNNAHSASPYVITCISNELTQSKTERDSARHLAVSQNHTVSSPTSTETMSYPPQSARLQEKAELQQINDRFTTYIQRVRQLGESGNQVDSTAFMKTTKILEQEINNLKNLYEQELQKLRIEVETVTQEKTTYQVQSSKHQQNYVELQNRLSSEITQNRKLMDDTNALQRKLYQVEAELHGAKLNTQNQLTMENVTRENENLKKRIESEELAHQQAEDRILQLLKKIEFNENIHIQQMTDLSQCNDLSAETIMNLETQIRELSKKDTSVGDIMVRVREAAESELNNYKIEIEMQHSKDMSALKTQMNSDYSTIHNLQKENERLQLSVDDLSLKIRDLEGQVSGLEHQKRSFDNSFKSDRKMASEHVRTLEAKLRQVQEMLFDKIQEVSNSRESNVPLKTEIESLKTLLEAEERRLQMATLSPKSQQSPVNYRHDSPTTPQVKATPYSMDSEFSPSYSNKQAEYALNQLTNVPANRIAEYPANAPANRFAEYPENILSNRSSDGNFPINQPAEYTTDPPPEYPSDLQLVKQPSDTFISCPYFSNITAQEKTPAEPIFDPYSYPTLLPSMQPGSYERNFPITCTPMHLSGDAVNLETNPNFAYDPTQYMYMDRSPNIDRVSVNPSPGDTPRDMDALTSPHTALLRSKSAPVDDKRVHLVSTSLGRGKDYFDEMFQDLQRETLYTTIRPKTTPLERIYSSTSQDYAVATNSAISDIKILEVNQDGKYVRLFNDGAQEIEFGNFMIQQNVGGHPVAVFRFLPHSKFAGNSTITVHSGMNDVLLHNPPTDYVWKEQQKWGTGPECTTILCRPNGQAIAWTTAAHRFSRNLCEEPHKYLQERQVDDDSFLEDDDSLKEMVLSRTQPEPVYLKREKLQRPTLTPARHPHGMPVNASTHPHTGQPRTRTLGNDNSSYSRQSRSQTTRPDPIQGTPNAGAAAQKIGSAPLRKVATPQSATIKGNGSVVNKSEPGDTSSPPSPFMNPHNRFTVGLNQVQSQHHTDYIPPMPRPPLFSTW